LEEKNESELTPQDKKGLKEMISRNELIEAMKIIKDYVKDSSKTYDQIIILQRRLTDIKDRRVTGTISFGDENLKINEITSAMLEIISSL